MSSLAIGKLAGDGSGNNRNGPYDKTVLTDAGAIPIRVPRDRSGEFGAALLPKHQRRLGGINHVICGLMKPSDQCGPRRPQTCVVHTDDSGYKLSFLAIGNERGGALGTGTRGWQRALNPLTFANPGRIDHTKI